MEYSREIRRISPSITLTITAKAKELKDKGIDIISFGAGEPDFDTPINIKNAAIKAIQEGKTKYTAVSGIKELKKAICDKLMTDNNLSYNPDQIIVSTGAKQSLYNTFTCLLNPEDEVLIPVPYWLSYPELVKLASGVPKFVNTKQSNNFKYDIATLKSAITAKSKVLLINSPSNPSGAVYSRSELEELADFAKLYNLAIISDEIYEKLIYNGKEHISIASINDDAYNRTVVINGFSKAYSMTGWRMGYAAGSVEIVKLMTSLQSHSTSNPNTIAQYAALEALSGSQQFVASMVIEFEARKNYMCERISKINNISCVNPDGAFYVMVDISKLIGKSFNNNIISSSLVFSHLLLESSNVAVIPGSAFGLDNFIRLSYATSMDNIKRGLDIITIFINNIC